MKAIAIVVGLMLVVVVGARAAEAPNVAGVWEYKDPAVGVNSITFTLNADGTGKLDEDAIRYTVDGNTIKVVNGGETTTYSFKIDGDSMTVSGGDLDKPTTFVRKGGGVTKKGLGSKIKAMGDATKTDAAAKTDVKPAAAGPIGTWQATDGDQVEIRENAMVYRGTVLPATLTANNLRLSVNGVTADCPFEVSGDSMTITINGQALALKRVGGGAAVAEKKADAGEAAKAGAAADPKSIVGTWDSPEGSVIVRADGTVRSKGSEGKWKIDDQYITLSDDKQWVKIPYKLDGDKLILGSGPTQTLTRSAGGPAGVYTVTESSLDPQFFMSITHYLTLYPDGTVGFEKTEGGASRTKVTENFERFRSWKLRQGQAARTYGKWQADANGGVTIQWQGAFKNATWEGRIDPKTGKLVLPHAGILKEGDTLAYEKQ